MARDRDAPGSLPDDALALRALPPDRFTKERDALAARLASAGDAVAAAAVRRLRRPVGLAWLLNLVARARPREVDALVAAGDRLRAGQRKAISGGGAAALREAEEAVRAAARALRTEAPALAEEAGRAPDAAALARLELLLRLVASAPGEARDALRAGTLEREPEVAPGDLSGLAMMPGGASAREPPAREKPARERAAAEARARRDATRREAAERARAERLRRRLRREARERDRARAAASRALARAQEEAAAARRRLEEAEARVAEARRQLDALRKP